MDEFWDKMFICRAQEDKYEFWPLLWMIKLCAFVCITDNTDDHQIYVKFPDAEIADAHIFFGEYSNKSGLYCADNLEFESSYFGIPRMQFQFIDHPCRSFCPFRLR